MRPKRKKAIVFDCLNAFGPALFDVGFPKAVLVAVAIDRDRHLVLQKGELRGRGLPGVEVMDLGPFVGEEVDPFDVVVLLHRMGGAADDDLDHPLGFADDRDVLLGGGVGRVGLELAHRLPAANGRGAEVVELEDDGAAFIAFIEFSHFSFSPFARRLIIKRKAFIHIELYIKGMQRPPKCSPSPSLFFPLATDRGWPGLGRGNSRAPQAALARAHIFS